jgi:acetolactate synthase-1/2/3 large subunit
MTAEASSQPTCADLIVGALAEHGTDKIYCLPGVQNDAFFNALFDAGDRIRAIHTRHEQGAAYMALGAALASGQPAVYSVVPGPGLLNTTAALATAYSANAKVFCLTGQINSRLIDRGIGMLHEIPDQIGILKTLTKWADRVAVPEAGAAKVAEAFAALASGRPRPVGLEVPPDILATKVAAPLAATATPASDPEVDEDRIAEAARLLASAKRPLILVGGGAQDASVEVKRLAERLEAPVFANRMGRGVLDSRHPLSVSLTHAHHLWRDCDVFLSVGARAQGRQLNWGLDDGIATIQIDIDPAEMKRAPEPRVPLVGRSQTVLEKLLAALERQGSRPASRRDEMAALKAKVAEEIAFLQPQLDYVAAIRAALPENGVFVEELTQVGYVSRIAMPVYNPRSFISSGYQGTLGWGYPTALGVKLARPDAPVVSVHGDGGFGYCLAELSTAVRHKIPQVAVVFDDGAYGNVRRMQQELYGNRVIASDLANPDWQMLAKSFGIMAMKAKSPAELESALRRGIAADEPVLIEVPCGPMPDPWNMIERGKARSRKS